MLARHSGWRRSLAHVGVFRTPNGSQPMTRQIRFNAFDMNCVGHQSPGLWAHPRDRSWQHKDLEYWTAAARTLARAKFAGLFLADVLGVYDGFNGYLDAALRHSTQVPVNDPLQLVP